MNLLEVATTRHDLVGAIESRSTLDEVKRLYARHMLAVLGGNRSQAARLLGVDRKTLLRWEGPSPTPRRGRPASKRPEQLEIPA